mgnify:CR=1 FL=1
MSSLAHCTRDTPSGRLVLAIGFLMTGSFWVRPTEVLQVSLEFTWFLPLLAGWLASRHGIGVLRAWWPLAILPSLGLTLAMESDVREDIEAGRLVRVLDDWTPDLSPLSLYYPSRRNPTAAFKAFIDFARRHGEAGAGSGRARG